MTPANAAAKTLYQSIWAFLGMDGVCARDFEPFKILKGYLQSG